jgi:quinol monooxygenase YgiN
MFERYKGKAAFDAHNSQPIIQKLLNEWKYIRGVKAWFPPADLDTAMRLPAQ